MKQLPHPRNILYRPPSLYKISLRYDPVVIYRDIITLSITSDYVLFSPPFSCTSRVLILPRSCTVAFAQQSMMTRKLTHSSYKWDMYISLTGWWIQYTTRLILLSWQFTTDLGNGLSYLVFQSSSSFFLQDQYCSEKLVSWQILKQNESLTLLRVFVLTSILSFTCSSDFAHKRQKNWCFHQRSLYLKRP
jgi:hypothetical protein